MTNLIDIPVPRPDAIVEELARPALRRIRRLRLGLALCSLIAIPGICSIGVIAGRADSAPIRPLSEDLSGLVLIAIFAGVLPALACWRIIGRDLEVVRRLVCDGIAYQGAIARTVRFYTGATVATIT